MTDEQINAAIAEAIDADPHWKCAKDYCTDLNAMHEAEKVLCRPMKESDSDRIIGDRMHAYAELIGYAFDATARQRAEAFLRTLGKWDDQSGDTTEMEAQK